MNERIKELAEQAQKVIWPADSNVTELTNLDVEKFAELIVRECSHFVEDKFDFCGDEIIIAEQILKHFGVEE
jgi:hypothetical protein